MCMHEHDKYILSDVYLCKAMQFETRCTTTVLDDDWEKERPRYLLRTTFAHGTNILQISTGIYLLYI